MRTSTTLVLAIVVSLLASPASAQIVVTAGKVTHTVEAATAIATLPSAWGNPKYGKNPLPKPAIEGNVWYVIRGRSANGDTQVRSLDSGSFWIELDGKKITPKAATSFQPDETSIMRSVQVPPGGSQAWVAFFQVPTGATGVKLMMTDFVGGTRKIVASAPLPTATPGAAPAAARGSAAATPPPAKAPVAAPAPAGALTAQSVVGTWKLDEPKSKAAPDGNGALLMRTLSIKADGTFEALYNTKGTWKIQGGKMIVTYECCPGQPAAVVLDGGHMKFPAPSNVKKFCYMVKGS
ncbi:MAG: hypothetical protein IPL75_06365 [Acidobacteria bacterium]|nr:hypothetical protein [Acidobacteriota bacterium]